MSLPLPEALLLFALHPERGTILPSAYLAIDVALRGAVLAELKLTGHVQARLDGQVRVPPHRRDRPLHPVLRDAMDLLAEDDREPPTVRRWYQRLDERMPDLRDRLGAVLCRRGILRSEDRQRSSLPQQATLPATDPGVRDDLVLLLRASLDDGDEVTPRDGMLLALVVAARLEQAVFGELAELARSRADWVCKRDVLMRAASSMVAEAEQV